MAPTITLTTRLFLLSTLCALLFLTPFNRNSHLRAQTNQPTVPPGFTQELVTEKLDGPTAFVMAPDGRIYFTQKSGTVRVWHDNQLIAENFIDISQQVNHAYNRGLVGIALHPNFPRTPYVYLAYVYQPQEAYQHKEIGARLSRVMRVSADSANLDKALPGSEVVILGAGGEFEQIGNPDNPDRPPFSCEDDNGKAMRDCIPVEGTAHQANMLRFGRDGALYVGVGDGSEAETAGLRAQDLDSLSGKMLRINPMTGMGYASNPYYNRDPQSNRAKVYMLGLRNPFRFTFHPTTGELVIGDVGKSSWEEVNRGRAGANFGWPCFESSDPGLATPPCDKIQANPRQVVFPQYAYPHTEGRVAIIGGDYYAGAAFPAEYRGAYFFGDYNVGTIWMLTGAGSNVQVKEFATGFAGLVQISTGADGNLYVLTARGGALYRIRWAG
ncbi:MAG: PQQ-dependent sugar dehydrogenase [Caldilineaceae bacterium]